MQTEWDVILIEVPDDNEISVIKIIYRVLGLSSEEAKDLVKAAKFAPKPVIQRVPRKEADTLQQELEQAGAKVNIMKTANLKHPKMSLPVDAVELDTAVLNEHYLALANLDSNYQDLMKAQKEFDETIYGLQKEFDETMSRLREQRHETISRLQEELKSTISGLTNNSDYILTNIESKIKYIESLKTKRMIEILLIIFAGVVAALAIPNIFAVLIAMFIIFIVRINMK